MTNDDIKANISDWTVVNEWQLDRGGPRERCYRQAYAMFPTTYAGIMVGLLLVYEFPRDLSERLDLRLIHNRDIGNIYLAISRDEGITWDFRFVYEGTALLRRFPSMHESTLQNWLHTTGEFVTWNNSHWIYASGLLGRHMDAIDGSEFRRISLYKVPLDRFAYFQGTKRFQMQQLDACLTTVPLVLPESHPYLIINADMVSDDVGGDVEATIGIQLLTVAARPDGSEEWIAEDARLGWSNVSGVDAIAHCVVWSRSGTANLPAPVQNTPVRLRFWLGGAARLFAFRFSASCDDVPNAAV